MGRWQCRSDKVAWRNVHLLVPSFSWACFCYSGTRFWLVHRPCSGHVPADCVLVYRGNAAWQRFSSAVQLDKPRTTSGAWFGFLLIVVDQKCLLNLKWYNTMILNTRTCLTLSDKYFRFVSHHLWQPTCITIWLTAITKGTKLVRSGWSQICENRENTMLITERTCIDKHVVI